MDKQLARRPCQLIRPSIKGWRNKRARGKEYDEFIDKFVQLVRKHLPHSLLHFEDFGGSSFLLYIVPLKPFQGVTNAQRLLDKYRGEHAVFNDDV